MAIHSTAVVSPDATLAADVTVGPFAVIGPKVTLENGVLVGPHAVITGETTVGARCRLSAHVVLGEGPQDRKHDPDQSTSLIIGPDNVFREFFTAHAGSSAGRGSTKIGAGGYFMASSHVAHDCVVGDRVMFANSVAIAGHVEVGDDAVLGGLCAVHQLCRIGRLSMLGGGAMCAQDVPPFVIAQGDRARIYGLNILGLRRAGLSTETVASLKDAFRVLFTEGLPRRTAMAEVAERHGACAEVNELLAFLASSERGVCRAGVRP